MPRWGKAQVELTLFDQIRLAKLREPVREFPGIPGRRFKFDGAWPPLMLAGHVTLAGSLQAPPPAWDR